MSITTVYDVTATNLASAPKGLLAGYDTGSGGIAWSAADFAAHPGAVHIDQDTAASDYTADVLDVERGAATIAEAATWFERALANYQSAKRPGQRYPAIYISAAFVTQLANALVNAGPHITPRLWVAHWGETTAEADAAIASAAGPWPVIAMQIANRGTYDLDLVSSAWLAAVSRPAAAGPPAWFTTAQRDLAAVSAAATQISDLLTANVH